jgi:hypothetical protein
MKITIFTSNNTRHNYFVNLLANCCDELFVIQECLTNFPGKINSHYIKSEIMENYFMKVNKAQKKIFKDNFIKPNKRCKISYISMQMGDLNFYNLNSLKKFLRSDLYLVFGSSYIKGNLINFLIKKKAINIHAGISPFYRGCDCNFWALYEKNYHLVGTTIHFLTKGLDSGPILYHAASEYHNDPFVYSMSTIKSAFLSIEKYINNKKLFKFKPFEQSKFLQKRYSRKKDFTDTVIKSFLENVKKKCIVNSKLERDCLIKPFILQKKYFFKDLTYLK